MLQPAGLRDPPYPAAPGGAALLRHLVDDLCGQGEADAPPTLHPEEPVLPLLPEHPLEVPVGQIRRDPHLSPVDDVEEEELVEPLRLLEDGDDNRVVLEVGVQLNRPLQALDPVLAVDEPEALLPQVQIAEGAPAQVLVRFEGDLAPDVQED